MVAVATEELSLSLEGADRRRRTGPAGILRRHAWRWVILLVTAVFVLVPLYAGVRYAAEATGGGWTFRYFSTIPSQQGFAAAFGLSLRLALVTTVITLGLLVPTAVYVHLRVPQLRRVLEAMTILPIVIPPVVLILGVLQVAPSRLKATPYLLALEYAVLAMPFAYRSLDAGLRAIDVRTRTEAAMSLGAPGRMTLLRVLLPNLRAALLSATVLTVALVLGEFTIASLDQYETFPVWVVSFDQDNSHTSTAVSVLALAATWVLLMLIALFDRRRGGRVARPARSGGPS